ncbi:MAG: cupin domain-containing protein [Pirellulaceae bacterium]|nr:cupin domain-containing protein [Pirellulaceae bacterium]
MSTQEANPGGVIDVQPLGNAFAQSKTQTLLNTQQMKLVRLVMPAGKQIPQHKAPGEITVQCIEGEIEFTAMGETTRLSAGQLLHLAAGEPHSLESQVDSSVLVTMALS